MAKLLLDTGPGCLQTLQELTITYNDIDCLCYTHIHLDHIAALPWLLFIAKNAFHLRVKPLYIYGPKGIGSFYQKMLQLYESQINPTSFDVSVKELAEEAFSIKDVHISSIPVPHFNQCLAYRIENKNGYSIVYSGDTDYTEALSAFAADSDLLLLECAMPEGQKVNGHLIPSLAGKIAAEARAKKLIIIHRYPICNDKEICHIIKEIYSGTVVLAYDLMTFEI
ncbi:MAG: MBL fold metallo-hydrolase [Candidatus Omnitrophica bacterium]|nr:MBL fold metallo-hydrolase [Candidatus Omnitrophota bacterium]